MIISKMAFRNIFRQRRRSFLTALTMAGGFFLVSISLGLNFGMYSDMIETFTRKSYGQVKIHESTYLEQQSLYKTISDWQPLAEKLRSIPNVSAVAPRLYSGGLFSVGSRTAMGSLTGIDPIHEELAFGFNRHIISGNPLNDSGGGVFLGEGLAKSLRATVGDTLFVLTQGADGSMANELYPIVGVVNTGSDMNDKVSAYLPLKTMQELLVLENRVHELALLSGKKGWSEKLATVVTPYLPEGTKAFPWQEFLASFKRAMKADQESGYVSLVLIMAIVAGGILNTVLMAVLERRREYGLLKALGTTPRQIFALVFSEMSYLSFISIGIGSLLALPANIFFAVHGITLPEPMTYGGMNFSVMHGEVSVAAFLIPAILVMISTMIVTVYPALMAAKTTPADSMRKN